MYKYKEENKYKRNNKGHRSFGLKEFMHIFLNI